MLLGRAASVGRETKLSAYSIMKKGASLPEPHGFSAIPSQPVYMT